MKTKNKAWKVKLEFDTSKVSKLRIAEIIFNALNRESGANESEANYRQEEFSHVWDSFMDSKLVSAQTIDFDAIHLDQLFRGDDSSTET